MGVKLLRVTAQMWSTYKNELYWTVKVRDLYGKKHTIEIKSKELKPNEYATKVVSKEESIRISDILQFELEKLHNQVELKIKNKKK